MSKRQNPTEIVANAKVRSTRLTHWIHGLSRSDMAFVRDVIAEAKKRPDVSIKDVAELLKRELNISVGAETVARFLRERLNGKK